MQMIVRALGECEQQAGVEREENLNRISTAHDCDCSEVTGGNAWETRQRQSWKLEKEVSQGKKLQVLTVAEKSPKRKTRKRPLV